LGPGSALPLSKSQIAAIAAAILLVVTLLVLMVIRPAPYAAQAPVVQAPTAPRPAAPGAPQRHTITVKFDYDFTRTHACGPKNHDKFCVKQFDVYNLTQNGGRFKLFSFPAPRNAKTVVRGLSGTSPELPFSPGQHLIAVTAESNVGRESSPMQCQTMIDINP
jgi:hypothetical protein